MKSIMTNDTCGIDECGTLSGFERTGVIFPACYAGLSYRTPSAFTPPAYAGGSDKPSLTGILCRVQHIQTQTLCTQKPFHQNAIEMQSDRSRMSTLRHRPRNTQECLN